MRRFYAPPQNTTGTEIRLDADETRHLRDVLRLHVGDEVFVFDGEGNEYRCSIALVEKKSSQLKAVEKVVPASPESNLDLTLAAAVLKGDKFDLVIQKSVELGVTAIVPISTIRTDIKLKTGDKRTERWRRIALEATKQCGRARLMQISEPLSFQSLIEGSEGQNPIIFSERDGESFSVLKELKSVTAIIGPEGGWEDSELELARSHACRIITLGGRTMRAETAAMSIAAVLQHRFGDLN